MNRLAGIIIAVLGLILAVLSYTKVVPGMTQTGIILCLFGLLIIGLSFVPKTESNDTPRMSTFETLTKIFYAPGEVFENLRRHPRWLAAVVIMALLAAVFTNAFIYRLTPEKVVGYTIDKTKEMSWLDENTRAEIEKGRAAAIEENKNVVSRTATAVTGFAGYIFWLAFLALLFFLFIMAMGGQISYWQSFAVAAYSLFPVSIIRSIISTIILFIRDPSEIHPILGQSSLVQDSLNFLASPATSPVLYTLLSAFGLLSFYWVWLAVTGLKNTGEKVTPTMAWTAVLTIWLVGVMLSVVMALIFPSFMS